MEASSAELCRTCRRHDASFESIFTVIENLDISNSYAEIINISVSSVHIFKNDGFSDKICSDCSRKVEDFQKLKLKIEKSDQFFKNALPMCVQHSESILKEQSLMDGNIIDLDGIKREVDWPIMQHDEMNIEPDYKKNIISTSQDEIMKEKNTSEDSIDTGGEKYSEDQTTNEVDFVLKQEELYCEEYIDENEKEYKFIPCGSSTSELMRRETSPDDSCYPDENEDDNYEEEYTSEDNLNQGNSQQSFEGRNNLENHFSEQTGEKKFTCKHCNKDFRIKGNLRRHLLRHSDNKPFECEYCNTTFIQKNQLKIHLLNNIGDEPIECKHCHIKFIKKCQLQIHLLKHIAEKSIKYPKRFIKENNLQRLIKHSDKKKFGCEHCNEKFTRRDSLTKHLINHVVAGEKLFQCTSCPKKFTIKNNLKRHLLSHSGEKTFECEICKKKFTTKRNVMRHLLIHTEEKKFECEHCHKKFRQRCNLQTHLYTIHELHESRLSMMALL